MAVEAVAGPVRMPRRLLDVLDSEGLFNDATAVVIFQTAVLATVRGADVGVLDVLWRFALGAIGAVVLGLAVAWVARWVDDHVTDTAGRSALTLVLPFAVYLAADELGVSGVVAVVVVALQTRATSDVDEAAERLVQRSFWDVVEMLVTGVAFGLVGLELRGVVDQAGAALPGMLGHAAVVIGVVLAVRAVWMVAAWPVLRRSSDGSAAPRTGREAAVLTWCGMRGLATLALALSLPTVTASGAPFPARAEIVVIAAATLVATLVVPAFTLPTLVRLLGVAEDADAEHAAERVVTRRARQAAFDRLSEAEKAAELPDDVAEALRDRMALLEPLLRGTPAAEEDRDRIDALRRNRHVVQRIQSEVLAAARAEVLAARRTPGVDPHAADRVLQRLDLRTVLLD